MSAMTHHIRVLRAEAHALTDQGKHALEAAQVAIDKGNTTLATMESTVAAMLVRLSSSKLAAADQLEADEPKLREDERPITYNPKGKR
jgi:hypothetical protein